MSTTSLVKGYVNVVAKVHRIESALMRYRITYVILKGNEYMDYSDYIIDERIWRPDEIIGDLVGLRCRINYDGSLNIRTRLKVIKGGV